MIDIVKLFIRLFLLDAFYLCLLKTVSDLPYSLTIKFAFFVLSFVLLVATDILHLILRRHIYEKQNKDS